MKKYKVHYSEVLNLVETKKTQIVITNFTKLLILCLRKALMELVFKNKKLLWNY